VRGVDRDRDRLRRAAADVASDLTRVSGTGWKCIVDDQYVLTVTFRDQSESTVLESAVEDEEWYVSPKMTPEQQALALDADASEAVADEVLEVLRAAGWPSPHCDEHRLGLTVCGDVWLGNGPPGHDVAAVGHLGE
jgi:hypothetical protein